MQDQAATPPRARELIAKLKVEYPHLKQTLAALRRLAAQRPSGQLTWSDVEFVALIEEREEAGDASAERLADQLEVGLALEGCDASTQRVRVPAIRPRERRDRRRHTASQRSSARSGDSGSDDAGPSEPKSPESPEPPTRRLCAFCGLALPVGKRKYCSDRHADRDRQQKKRARDRHVLRPRPTTPDETRMKQFGTGELERLLALATCRCNGHHILDRDPALGHRCVKCGRQRPGYGPKAMVA